MISLVRPHSPAHRGIAAVLFLIFPLTLVPHSTWAHDFSSDEARRLGHVSFPHGFNPGWTPPAPLLSPREIVLNKAAQVSKPRFDLPAKAELSQDEIQKTMVLDTPLRATARKQASKAERVKLTQVLKAFAEARRTGDVRAVARLKDFVAAHPESGYNTSLLIEAADLEWRQGYFEASVKTLKKAWAGSKGFQDIDDRRLAEQALGALLERSSVLGKKAEVRAMLDEAAGRPIGGYAANSIDRAKEALWFLENRAESNIFCGFAAANEICVPLGEKAIYPDIQNEQKIEILIRDGLSAYELKEHSRSAGGSLRVVKRVSGSNIVSPSVIHWNFGHYSAITEAANGQYRVADKHLSYDSWMSTEAVEQQMSGYFLVSQAVTLPAGYAVVADSESKGIFGRFCTHQRDTEGDMAKGGGTGCPPQGMAGHSFSLMNPGLAIQDSPLVHQPPYGPVVQFRVTYDQRSSFISDLQNVGNLGPRWTHAYKESVDLLGSGAPNTFVRWQKSDGSYYDYNYHSPSQSYTQRYKERPQMTYLTVPNGGPGYQVNYSDGSKKLFKQPNSGTPTKYLLTQIVDALGNTLSFQYDGNLRLVTITDALGQDTTISYTPETGDNVSSDTYKIRKITDPFARVAKFKYTTVGQLQKIIDPVGIASEFHYANGDFIDRLITPYGVTEFSHGEVPNGTGGQAGRWVESRDAAGDRERIEANDNGLPPTYVASPQAPSTVSVNGSNVSFTPKNSGLNYRNTFHWNRQQMQNWPGDYTKCKIYHWLRGSGDTITSVLASTKDPLEGRVWYNYPSQSGSETTGNANSPSKVVRAVESTTGTTVWAMSQTTYNDLGLVTGTVDPQGREMKYEYDTNKQDLLYTKVKNGGSWETLSAISQYHTLGGISTHLPEIITDASGLQTEYTYNDKGQVTEVTLSKGAFTETKRYIYDSDLDGNADASGYLIRVEHTSPSNPAQFVTLRSFTYDSAKRVRTITDTQGYTITHDYDDLNRLTVVTHPDSTTEQVVYDNGVGQTLDVWAAKDRAGRWARMRYNHRRELIAKIDPLARLTQFEWCRCGNLRKVIDPMNKVTQWKRDAQGRAIEKVSPDGDRHLYSYEPLSGRPATVAYPNDVVNSVTTLTYRYHLNGQLQKKDYTSGSMSDITHAATDYLGRATSMADGQGTTNFSYISLSGSLDGAGKMLTSNGPLADDTLRYNYNWQGLMVKAEIVANDGTSVSRSEEITTDSLGRVTQMINDLGTFTPTYDSGNLSGMPDAVSRPGGFNTQLVHYAPNAGANARQLQTIHNRQGTNTAQKHDYAYDLAGSLVAWDRTDAAAHVTSWALRHDLSSQLTELEEEVDHVPSKTEAWHYDASGNISSTTIIPAGQPGTLQIRSYTGSNQLDQVGGIGKTVVQGAINEASTVTVNGDAAVVTKLGPSGPWQFQREINFPAGTTNLEIEATDGDSNVATKNYTLSVSADADQTLEYDANGNTTVQRDGTGTVIRQFTWDYENRLLSIQSSDTPVSGVKRTEFGYDGSGRRITQVEKEHNGTTWTTQAQWTYIWDGLDLVQKRDTSTGTVLINYFTSGEKQGSTSIVYLKDHLGSVRSWYRVSDGSRGEADFGIYGQRTIVSTGPGLPERGYTGHLQHSISGLILAPLRVYDPELGRWLSEDPIAEKGGINLYEYAGNRPGDATDPLGLDIDIFTGNNDFLGIFNRDFAYRMYFNMTSGGAGTEQEYAAAMNRGHEYLEAHSPVSSVYAFAGWEFKTPTGAGAEVLAIAGIDATTGAVHPGLVVGGGAGGLTYGKDFELGEHGSNNDIILYEPGHAGMGVWTTGDQGGAYASASAGGFFVGIGAAFYLDRIGNLFDPDYWKGNLPVPKPGDCPPPVYP